MATPKPEPIDGDLPDGESVTVIGRDRAIPAPNGEPEPEPGGPGPIPSSEADGWAVLDGMRRRIDDHGTLARRTQTQVQALAESIAQLVADQRKRTSKLNLNSFVAYVLFTVLVGSAAYFVYRSRSAELVGDRDRAVAERDVAKTAADAAAKATAARAEADAKAWEVYQLLEAGKRAEAKDKLDGIRDLPLSKTERAILTATAHDTAVVAGDAAFKAAIASFKAGKYADIIAPLETALAAEPPGMRALQMHYYLGVAYAKGTELDKATTHLTAAVAGEVDQEDARFQLASVLDRAGQYSRARAEYDRFATAHPQSQLAVFAMRRSATLARMPAAGSAVPAAGSAARPIVPGAGSAVKPVTPPVAPKPAVVSPPKPDPDTGTGRSEE